MNTPERAGVLVDLDGTLVDTNYLHALAWSRALRDLGEWAPMNAIHRLVGVGGDQLVPQLLGHDLDGADAAHDRHYTDLVLAMGDSVWDIDAARAAGMGCVTVESGGSSRHELAEAGAIAIYRDVQELEAQLMTSPIGNLISRLA